MSGREDVHQSILEEEYWKYHQPEFDEEPEIREIEGFPGYFIDSYGGVSKFCNGEFKPLKPWPLYAKNLSTGEELHFDSRNEAASYIGIPECGISSVITGYISQTHGWTFWED